MSWEGYDRGYFDMPGLEAIFDPFWQGLNRLADTPCPGCRPGARDDRLSTVRQFSL